MKIYVVTYGSPGQNHYMAMISLRKDDKIFPLDSSSDIEHDIKEIQEFFGPLEVEYEKND